MKKLNYITVLGLAAGLTFAGNAMADEEQIVGVGDNNSSMAWNTTSKSLFEALADNAVLSLSVVRNNTSQGFSFGTYTYKYDQNGNIAGVNYSELGSVTGKGTENALTSQFIDTQPYQAGDIVGVYITDTATATTLFSSPYYYGGKLNDTISHPDTHSDIYTLGWGGYNGEAIDPNGTYSIMFDTDPQHIADGTWPAPIKEWSGGGEANIRIQITGYAPVTPAGGQVSGGPLPGVWATIALAGAASAYLKRRRKENK